MPLLAFVGRLVEQKGIDLIAQVMQEWVLTSRAQWVILGTGDAKFQEQLALLAQRFPQKVAVRFQFSDPLAHRIEAAADLFLMPSRFEPCGLSQMYSLKYGTVPVVRVTGGLADTIVDTTEETLAAGSAEWIYVLRADIPRPVVDAQTGLGLFRPPRCLAPPDDQRNDRRLVVDEKRQAVCRSLRNDDRPSPGANQ